MNSEVLSETMYREINDNQNEQLELITTNKNIDDTTKKQGCICDSIPCYCDFSFCFYICMIFV
jgi:hypothetical protein